MSIELLPRPMTWREWITSISFDRFRAPVQKREPEAAKKPKFGKKEKVRA